ncbi:hypothetical protein L7F22_039776 [Adiantum nelumboides]|nr:hypothetical protein [Adiantum nelumboides]
MDEAMKREEEKMRDSGYKYLSIPAHGEEFFSMLFKKDWNDKSMVGITRDKIYSLCTAKITAERRKELLHMMALTKLKDSKGGHFTDYKKLRAYMRQEAYWQGMYEEAILHIEKLEVEGPKLPGWLLDCTRLKTIDSMPVDTEKWLDKEDEHSMFSPLILEKGITTWECSHCLWWLKYPLGIVPKCQQDLQARGDIHTYVDALLVDVEAIDDIAWQSIETWFKSNLTLYERVYHLKGEKSEYVARLVFVDFPTAMLVYGCQNVDTDEEFNVLERNHFSVPLVKGVVEIANVHLVDEDFLVTLSLAQHLGTIVKYASKFGLQLYRSWTLMCDGGYFHPQTEEQVLDLTIGLFYRKSASGSIPLYDREAGECVSSQFSATKSYITESSSHVDGDYTLVDEVLVSGGAECTELFFKYFTTLLTER